MRFLKNLALGFLLLTISSCKVYKLGQNDDLVYENNVKVTINKVQSQNSQGAGGYSIMPPAGHTLLMVDLSLTNTSNTDQEVDFMNFFLLDNDRNVKYPVQKVFLPTIIALTGKVNLTLDKNSTVKRTLMFTYPKKKMPDFLQLGKEIYNLKFQQD